MQVNYSLGYVIGTLKGDGSLHRSIDYHYFDHKSRQVVKAKAVRRVPRFRFAMVLGVMDKDFADTFAEHLEKVTGKRPCRTMTKRGEYKAILISKEWYDKLLPLKTDLEWIRTADTEVKRGFLRGMFDSEGSIQKRDYGRRVTLYNKNIPLLKLCQLLLFEFGVNSFFRDENNIKGATCSRVTFGSKNDVEKFRREINFSIKRKRDVLECF